MEEKPLTEECKKSDTIVAKNYLSDSELSQLNLITTAFLDMAESRASRHIVSTMDDWKKVPSTISCNDGLRAVRYSRESDTRRSKR